MEVRRWSGQWAATEPADVVIEAVVEKLDVKQAIFSGLEDRLKPGAILATNTSSIELERIAEAP